MIKTLLGNRVLIKPIEVEEATKTGIILQGSMGNSLKAGEVVLVGTGNVSSSSNIITNVTPINIGDRVTYSYAGEPVIIDGDRYNLIRETDLIGIL